MSNVTHADINLKEDATIKLNLKGLWAIVVSVAVAAVTITTTTIQMNYKVERLSIESQQRHEQVMATIHGIDMKQNLFALKTQVIEALVWSRRDHDDYFNVTNTLDMKGEAEYRRNLRTIIEGDY
jgi:hypothetical protein